MELSKIKDIVEKVLEEYPETRTDDNLLILRVIQEKDKNTKSKTFEEVMKNCQMSFESITRARRKVQQERPELVDPLYQMYRGEKQLEFFEFYRG